MRSTAKFKILVLSLVSIPTLVFAQDQAGIWQSQRHILTPQQLVQEQQRVQERMAQQMPARFRAGYERMLRQHGAIEHQQHGQQR